VKNGKLQPSAYRPPPDDNEVSVMRSDWIGADTCRQHAKDLEKPPQSAPAAPPAPTPRYCGLAVLSAKQIRDLGIDVLDDRNEFDGHANIRHEAKEVRGDPNPPEEVLRLRDRARALAKLANYLPDPNPSHRSWQGPELKPRVP
jgi:hypothetical protein